MSNPLTFGYVLVLHRRCHSAPPPSKKRVCAALCSTRNICGSQLRPLSFPTQPHRTGAVHVFAPAARRRCGTQNCVVVERCPFVESGARHDASSAKVALPATVLGCLRRIDLLVAVVVALGFVLELAIRGLVSTSGAIAIVLCLAIQSTLGDVFAGIVLNPTASYHLGDWIAIDEVEGKVLKMNWRAGHPFADGAGERRHRPECGCNEGVRSRPLPLGALAKRTYHSLSCPLRTRQ